MANNETMDNLSENYVLQKVLSDPRVESELFQIYDLIDEKEKIVVEPEGSFISNFYQKV